MTTIREEILGEMIKADNNGSIYSSNYGILTEQILKLIEKRIDSMIPEKLDRKHSFELGYSAALNDILKMLK